jgi:DNA-binding PucR family transcriptional regulator
MHAYVDPVVEAVVARHEQVHTDLHRTRREHRRRLLTQILDGTIDALSEELDRELGYSLADTHLALLIHNGHASPSATDIAALRGAVDARGTLVIEHTARTWLVWLGRPGGFGTERLERLRRALAETGLTVAIGEPGHGLAGLRRTRQHALDAARVQRALGVDGPRCVWAREVRLETLLLANKERAVEFLTDELGLLNASDPFTRRLRETVLAWLTMGSYGGAAALLGVHENTVRNRLRAAQDILGVSLTAHRTELLVALRLERVLRTATGESTSS